MGGAAFHIETLARLILARKRLHGRPHSGCPRVIRKGLAPHVAPIASRGESTTQRLHVEPRIRENCVRGPLRVAANSVRLADAGLVSPAMRVNESLSGAVWFDRAVGGAGAETSLIVLPSRAASAPTWAAARSCWPASSSGVTAAARPTARRAILKSGTWRAMVTAGVRGVGDGDERVLVVAIAGERQVPPSSWRFLKGVPVTRERACR